MIGARWQAGAALGVAALALLALPALPGGESERDRMRRRYQYDEPQQALMEDIVDGVMTTRTVAIEAPPQVYAEETFDLAVTVTATGYTIDGEELDSLQLIARFGDVARRAPGTKVVITAASDVPYARVVEVLDRARTAGLGKIAFTAEPR